MNPRLNESGALTVRSKVAHAVCFLYAMRWGQNVTYILPSRRPPFMHVCMKAGRLTSSSLTDLEHDYEVVGEGWVSLSDS